MNRSKIGGWDFLAIFSILLFVGMIAYFDLVKNELSTSDDGWPTLGALLFAYWLIKRLLPDPVGIDLGDEGEPQRIKIFEGSRGESGPKPVDQMNSWLAKNQGKIRVHETGLCTHISGGGTSGVIREVFVRYQPIMEVE